MAQAEVMRHVSSSDVLFPEEDEGRNLDDSYYSAPSTSTYSSFSHEVKYIFEPNYSPNYNTRSLERFSSISKEQTVSGTSNRNSYTERTEYPSSQEKGINRYIERIEYPCNDTSLREQSYQSHDSSELYQTPYGRSSLQPSQSQSELVNTQNNTSPARRHRLHQARSFSDLHLAHNNSLSNSPPQYVVRSQSELQNPCGGHYDAHSSPNQNVAHSSSSSSYSPDRNDYSEISRFPQVPELNEEECGDAPLPVVNSNTNLSTPPRTYNGYPPPVKPRRTFEHGGVDYIKRHAYSSRRKTWSPPDNNNMGNGSSFNSMRSYHSNDHLEAGAGDDGHFYEDLETSAPPKIAPVSGMLSMNKLATRGLIKPVAFKPVATGANARYVSPPLRSSGKENQSVSQDEGYVSQDYNSSANHSHSTSSASQGSFHNDSERSVAYPTSECKRLSDRPESYSSVSRAPGAGHQEALFMIQTPSPSDSGVCDLEAMLREKDAEMARLRHTMETNETAIFHVFQEKEQNWSVERKQLISEYEAQLQAQQQKALKMEQGLLTQLFKLQQERKGLQQECEDNKAKTQDAERQCVQAQDELLSTQAQHEECKWQLCQKNGEIALLKSQLKELQQKAGCKTHDVISLKSKLRDKEGAMSEQERQLSQLKNQLSRSRQDLSSIQAELATFQKVAPSPVESTNNSPSGGDSTNLSSSPVHCDVQCNNNHSLADLEAYRLQLVKLQTDVNNEREAFQKERLLWLEEKNKVIRYQKQLQLNYVQMYRKNRTLETEVQQLTLELENRDLKLLSMEGEESTC